MASSFTSQNLFMCLPKESTLKVYNNMCTLKIISNFTICKISNSKNGANFKMKTWPFKNYQEISISLIKTNNKR